MYALCRGISASRMQGHTRGPEGGVCLVRTGKARGSCVGMRVESDGRQMGGASGGSHPTDCDSG